MNNISMTTLHSLFAIHEQSLSSHLDMNRLSDGGFASYFTQQAFHHFCSGFSTCNKLYAGDNK